MGKGELELKRFQLPENIAGKGELEPKRFLLPENIAGKRQLVLTVKGFSYLRP